MAFQSPRSSKPFTPCLVAFVLVVFPVLYSARAFAQHHHSKPTGLEISTSAATAGAGRSIGERANRKMLQGLKGSISVPLFTTKLAMAHPQTAASEQALTQTPAETGSTVKKKSGKLKWILIAAAGAAVGGVVATRGGGSSESGMTTNPGPTVTVGPPTVGPPQ